MEDPDLELGGGRGGGRRFCFPGGGGGQRFCLPAFLPSVIFYFTQNNGGGVGPAPSALPRSATDLWSSFLLRTEGKRFFKTLT